MRRASHSVVLFAVFPMVLLLGLAPLARAQDPTPVPDAPQDPAAAQVANGAANIIDASDDAEAASAAADAPDVDALLAATGARQTQRVLEDYLASHPDDASARFGLGVSQFLASVERLAQGLHRYGFDWERVGMLSLWLDLGSDAALVPRKLEPEPMRYEDARALIAAWLDDLAVAEHTLALASDGGARLALHPGRIGLDLDGDFDADLTLAGQAAAVGGSAREGAGQDDVLVVFDAADVEWLRGYLHLLSAPAEIALAHDGRELFEHAAHLVFARVVSPYAFLQQPGPDAGHMWDWDEISDVIAAIHLTSLECVEPARMGAALTHLEASVTHSRESWTRLRAETDDDHEWIPNPGQHGALGLQVTAEMADAWQALLDEAEHILAGELLVPFWREDHRGVNLRRVFTEPRRLDPLLWWQGTAAAPYLEAGEQTGPDTWSRIQRAFGGRFASSALWFN